MGAQASWDPELHQRCEALARDITTDATGADEQARAWAELFRAVAPSLELWCRQSSVLRRAGLSSEDDWRAVFLRVVERLVRRRWANLRAYLEHRDRREQAGDLGPTPLEGWLRQLVKFAAADEVHHGLATKRMQSAGGARTVETMGRGRGPIQTSLASALNAKRRGAALREALATLEEDQMAVLLQRVHGASYDDIAAAFSLSPEDARDLVRSAKARLRRRLRQTAAAQEGS